MTTALLGWLGVVGAVICFGSFGVPIKSPAVREANVHPFVFQTFKSFWVFVTSFLVLLWLPWEFSWLGLVSATFWVPAGAAYVVGVANAGLGVTQAVSSSFVVVVSTLWGTIYFREPVGNPWIAGAAFVLLVAGVSLMAVFSVPAPPEDGFVRLSQHADESAAPGGGGSIQNPVHGRGSELDAERGKASFAELASAGPPPRERCSRDFLVGLSAAVFNGVWGGSVMAPMKLAHGKGGLDFVLSFGIGVALITSFLWLLLVVAKVWLWKEPIPPLQLKVMWLPGSLAGILWSCGNFFSMLAVVHLGQAVGYSSCQAAIMVSGLWGLFYYHEAPRGVAWWLLGALCCTGGIVLLGLFA